MCYTCNPLLHMGFTEPDRLQPKPALQQVPIQHNTSNDVLVCNPRVLPNIITMRQQNWGTLDICQSTQLSATFDVFYNKICYANSTRTSLTTPPNICPVSTFHSLSSFDAIPIWTCASGTKYLPLPGLQVLVWKSRSLISRFAALDRSYIQARHNNTPPHISTTQCTTTPDPQHKFQWQKTVMAAHLHRRLVSKGTGTVGSLSLWSGRTCLFCLWPQTPPFQRMTQQKPALAPPLLRLGSLLVDVLQVLLNVLDMSHRPLQPASAMQQTHPLAPWTCSPP